MRSNKCRRLGTYADILSFIQEKCGISHEWTQLTEVPQGRVSYQCSLCISRPIKLIFDNGFDQRRRSEVSSDQKWNIQWGTN